MYRLRYVLFVVLVLDACLALAQRRGPVVLEADETSKFSHILVKRQGNARMMIFVRDNGVEAIESMVSISRPYEMLVPYARHMFASYLLRPQPKRVLIVGLGGGAMVHFYRHYDPEVQVDAVEIDPTVVSLADKFFACRSEGNIRIITDDAFHFFRETKNRYDVIYMDAFLKPSAATDATGAPLNLKTAEFYRGLADRLEPGGVVTINLNVHRQVNDDVALVKTAFAQTYVFHVSSPNLIAVGVPEGSRQTPAALRERARELDRRFKATFSFQDLANDLRP